MANSYGGVVEVREVGAEEANQLLREGVWRLLEIKTVTSRIYRNNMLIKADFITSEWKDVYDEREEIVYILGLDAVKRNQ